MEVEGEGEGESDRTIGLMMVIPSSDHPTRHSIITRLTSTASKHPVHFASFLGAYLRMNDNKRKRGGSEDRQSWRLYDWLVVNYSKENNVSWPIELKDRSKINFDVHSQYKMMLKTWRRPFFDAFRRRDGGDVAIRLGDSVYSTTYAQLNFVEWVFKSGINRYAVANSDSIQRHMECTLQEIKTKKQTASERGDTVRRKALTHYAPGMKAVKQEGVVIRM
jgi:hypothetical protein